jgi:hypothetical protein
MTLENDVIRIQQELRYLRTHGVGGNGDGEDGNSVWITYHEADLTAKPSNPTGDGTTGGWSHTATDNSKWMSTKLAATVLGGTWSDPIQIRGADGSPGVFYYIKPVNGTAIKNHTGTLTIEARKLENGEDTLLSGGTIQLYDPSDALVTVGNGYVDGSDGFTGVLDSGDINGSKTIVLKDGIGGTPLDSITLIDVEDGADFLSIPDCALRLRLDEGEGDSVFDSSGNEAEGVVTNGSWVEGFRGSAIAFDGTANINMGNPESLQITGGLTLSVFAQVENKGSAQYLIAKSDAATKKAYALIVLANGTLSFYVYRGGTAKFVNYATTAIDDGELHHFAAVNDGTSLKLYIDGTPVKTGAAGGTVDNADIDLCFGSRSDGAEKLEGTIHEAMIFSRGLTEAEIVRLANLDVSPLITKDFAGADAVVGSVESDNGLAFVQAKNGGSWTPAGATTTLTVTYYRGGVAINERSVVVTRTDGTLSAPEADTVDGITYTRIGNGTSSLTIEFEHIESGILAAETVYVTQGGDKGDDGTNGADGEDGQDGEDGSSDGAMSDDVPEVAGIRFVCDSVSHKLKWAGGTIKFAETTYNIAGDTVGVDADYVYWTQGESSLSNTNVLETAIDIANGNWLLCRRVDNKAVPASMFRTVLAGALLASSLAAISANLGAITSGTITLSLGGDARLRIDSNGLAISNNAGTDWTDVIKNDSGTVRMFADILKAGEIITDKLASNAATVPVSSYTGGSVSIPPSTETTLQSASITSTGRPISIDFSAAIDVTGDSRIRIKRGGDTIYDTGSVYLGDDGGLITASIMDTPAAGSYTYTATFYGTGLATRYATARSLKILESKR